MQAYINLMRLNRPIGIFLLLWPTLIALWLAHDGMPKINTLLIFILGTILMRSAGCVINDFADRKFDLHVARTKQRPLTTGVLKPRQALILFTVLLSMAFFLALMLQKTTLYIAMIAAGLAIIYPYTKRVTNYPQLILGIAFASSIPMAYTEACKRPSLEAWILLLATVAWVVAYDTEYAMVDSDDDIKVGIKSTAIAFGKYDRTIIFILQIMSLTLFALVGYLHKLTIIFYLALIVGLGLILYQQWLIKDRDKPQCFRAFLLNNYFGLSIFIGIALDKVIN